MVFGAGATCAILRRVMPINPSIKIKIQPAPSNCAHQSCKEDKTIISGTKRYKTTILTKPTKDAETNKNKKSAFCGLIDTAMLIRLVSCSHTGASLERFAKRLNL